MLAQFKHKYLEELKMIRADEYGVFSFDYNEFLEDSSDDYPRYEDGLDKENSMNDKKRVDNFTMPPYDDGTMRMEVTTSNERHDFLIALHNLIEVSKDWLGQQDAFSITEEEKAGVEKAITIGEQYHKNLLNKTHSSDYSTKTNVELASADKDI